MASPKTKTNRVVLYGGKVKVNEGLQQQGRFGQRNKPRKGFPYKAFRMGKWTEISQKTIVTKASFQQREEWLSEIHLFSAHKGLTKSFVHDPPKCYNGKQACFVSVL